MQNVEKSACHCEADDRAEAIPISIKAMFFTTELTEDAEKFQELGKFAVAMKTMLSLPQVRRVKHYN